MEKKTAEAIWFNGKIIPWREATVHVMTHALHYGTSVFEGIRVYDSYQGAVAFRLTDHIERLYNSARIYRMPIPFAFDALIQACKDIVIANKLSRAYLRPLAFYGDVGMGIAVDEEISAEVLIAAFDWGAYLGEQSKVQGIHLGMSSWNRLAPNTLPTAAKAGGNYLSSVQISAEAKRNGFDEGIALDTKGYLSEASGANIFVVKQGKLYTPPAAAAILTGITRDTVMKLAAELGYEVIEEQLPREFLYLADELFLTGTATEIVPVCTLDYMQIGSGKPGEVTKALQAAFFGLFSGETQDKWGWLEPIQP